MADTRLPKNEDIVLKTRVILLLSKQRNLCTHHTSVLQTDRQMDEQKTYAGNGHICAVIACDFVEVCFRSTTHADASLIFTSQK